MLYQLSYASGIARAETIDRPAPRWQATLGSPRITRGEKRRSAPLLPAGTKLLCAGPAEQVVEQDGPRRGDVQGSDPPLHRKGDSMVRALEHSGANPPPLSTEDDDEIPAKQPILDLVELDSPLELGRDDPEALRPRVVEGTAEVPHPGHREPFDRAGAGPAHGRRERRRPTLREDQAQGSCRFRHARHGADVLRILHPVEGDEYTSGPGPLRRLDDTVPQQIPESMLWKRTGPQGNSLTRPLRTQGRLELLARNLLDGKARGLGESQQLGIRRVTAAATQPEPIEPTTTRPQRLSHGVVAV